MVTKINKLFPIQPVLNRPQLGVLIIKKHLADWIWGFVLFYISFSQAPMERQHMPCTIAQRQLHFKQNLSVHVHD